MPRPGWDGKWVAHGGSKGEVEGLFFFWGMGSLVVDVVGIAAAWVRLHGAYCVRRGFFSRGVRWVKGRRKREGKKSI
jgi:hypothetical protein